MLMDEHWMRAGQANGAYRGFWGLEAESEIQKIQIQNRNTKFKYKTKIRKYKIQLQNLKYRVKCGSSRFLGIGSSYHMMRHTHTLFGLS